MGRALGAGGLHREQGRSCGLRRELRLEKDFPTEKYLPRARRVNRPALRRHCLPTEQCLRRRAAHH
jgi:hypothetical protein